MRLLTEDKLEEARFILEDLAFRSPKYPNVLYNLGMVYSEFHELDIAIDTLNRCVNIVPLYSNAYVALKEHKIITDQLNVLSSSVFQCLCRSEGGLRAAGEIEGGSRFFSCNFTISRFYLTIT